jgi:hypothetical protein
MPVVVINASLLHRRVQVTTKTWVMLTLATFAAGPWIALGLFFVVGLALR